MAISLVSVGQKWTATIANALIAAVNGVGASRVTATSVAGSGVSLSGSTVVASAASAISVNGSFSSSYTVYDVVYNLTSSGAAGLSFTMRLSGTDAATNYDRQFTRGLNATNTTVQAVAQTSWALNLTSVTGIHVGKIRLFNPFVAVGTTGLLEAGTTATTMTAADGAIYQAMLLHRTATAYDGFTITASTGTLSGTINIIGIA